MDTTVTHNWKWSRGEGEASLWLVKIGIGHVKSDSVGVENKEEIRLHLYDN